jgi:hypothetical protein
MRLLNLSEEERSTTLRRAIEIARSEESSEDTVHAEDELELYLKASEEAGIPRAATLQALRERLLVPIDAHKPGDLVFAPSTDGRLYVATVIRTDTTSAIVQFAKGGELPIAMGDLRPLGLVPGRKLQFHKDAQWWNGSVKTYDTKTQQLELEAVAYGTVKKIKFRDIRLLPEVPTTADRVRALLWRASLIAGGIGVGFGWMLHQLFVK